MTNKKISALTASTTPLTGTEILPIVQGGVTNSFSVDNLTAGRLVNAKEFYSIKASATGINGVYTTVYTFPSISENQTYIISGNTGAVNDASTFGAVMFVYIDTSSVRTLVTYNAGALLIRMSGLDVQISQGAGADRPVNVTITRVG